jgi:sigma-B regulation protein RsbU (phosphoserine phosphatase)
MVACQHQTQLLIVDDVPENIKVLGAGLQHAGYIIVFATNGEQAIEIAHKHKIDLILLDIMMPGMDGYEVCRALKSDKQTASIPVIFITAKTQNEDILRGFETGAVDYITKPFNAAELSARVKTHLELERSRQIIAHQAEELAWTNKRLMEKNMKLQQAIDEIEALKGLLPVCSSCKKIRTANTDPDQADSWVTLEAYLLNHTAVEITHSICPDCMSKLYPDLWEPA